MQEHEIKSLVSKLPQVPSYFAIEIDRETDGRWIAEITDIPGVLAYGQTQEEATAKVQALALRVIANEETGFLREISVSPPTLT